MDEKVRMENEKIENAAAHFSLFSPKQRSAILPLMFSRLRACVLRNPENSSHFEKLRLFSPRLLHST